MEDFQSQFNKAIDNYAQNNQYSVSKVPYHTHNNTDSPLISEISLSAGTPIKFGLGAMISTSNKEAIGSTSEQIQTSIASGKDIGGTIGYTSNNLQLNLLHQPQNSSNQSFITAFRPPYYITIPGTTISVTAAGNTVTTSGYGFDTNVLTNSLINIYDSTGALVETQTIASNTATVITISGTWVNTTNNGIFLIYQPVFFGSADTIYQRFYTQEGTGAGIRFGVGTTNGGQNGLLYMDSAGDLYWRNKAGASTKLN